MTHDKESAVILTDRLTLAIVFGLFNRLDFIVSIPELSPHLVELARDFCFTPLEIPTVNRADAGVLLLTG